jgi:hypothetical protein
MNERLTIREAARLRSALEQIADLTMVNERTVPTWSWIATNAISVISGEPDRPNGTPGIQKGDMVYIDGEGKSRRCKPEERR